MRATIFHKCDITYGVLDEKHANDDALLGMTGAELDARCAITAQFDKFSLFFCVRRSLHPCLSRHSHGTPGFKASQPLSPCPVLSCQVVAARLLTYGGAHVRSRSWVSFSYECNGVCSCSGEQIRLIKCAPASRGALLPPSLEGFLVCRELASCAFVHKEGRLRLCGMA